MQWNFSDSILGLNPLLQVGWMIFKAVVGSLLLNNFRKKKLLGKSEFVLYMHKKYNILREF